MIWPFTAVNHGQFLGQIGEHKLHGGGTDPGTSLATDGRVLNNGSGSIR